MFRIAALLLLRMTVCAGLVLPTTCAAKLRLIGFKVKDGRVVAITVALATVPVPAALMPATL